MLFASDQDERFRAFKINHSGRRNRWGFCCLPASILPVPVCFLASDSGRFSSTFRSELGKNDLGFESFSKSSNVVRSLIFNDKILLFSTRLNCNLRIKWNERNQCFLYNYRKLEKSE